MTIQNFFASNDIPWHDDPAWQRTADCDDITRDNYAHDCDTEGLAGCGWCAR